MRNRIKELREELNYSQLRLSMEIEVSQETISAYESENYYPSVPNLLKLASFFNVSCDYILGISDVRFPAQKTENLSEQDIKLEMTWRRLPAQKKELFLAYGDGLLNSNT